MNTFVIERPLLDAMNCDTRHLLNFLSSLDDRFSVLLICNVHGWLESLAGVLKRAVRPSRRKNTRLGSRGEFRVESPPSSTGPTVPTVNPPSDLLEINLRRVPSLTLYKRQVDAY